MNGSRLSRRYRQRAKRRAKHASSSLISRYRSSRLEQLEDRILLNATNVAAGLDAAGVSHLDVADRGSDEWGSAGTLLVGTEEDARYGDTIASPDQGLLAYSSLLSGSTLSGHTELSDDDGADEPAEARKVLVKLRDQASVHARKVLGTWTRPDGEPFVGPRTRLQHSMELVQARSSAPVFPGVAVADLSFSADSSTTNGTNSPSLEPGAADASPSDLARWYQVDVPAGVDVGAALAQFSSVAEIEYAEPNYRWQLADEIPRVIEGLPDATTDPAYDQQWHHNNAKTWKGWDHLNTNGVYPGGTGDVVVAAIDTGVDYAHEELVANMWTNPGEIPGNGVDDDSNGFVDDTHGANVVSNPASHSGDPNDSHGHGTHVAGIIAAQAFNDRGGVGVAFNTKIMAIKAAQYSGTLTVQDIAEGIQYATDNGADVINMSFGGYQRSQIVVDALEVALNQAVLVAAAGNDSVSIQQAPSYPAALPWVLGVEASTPNDKLAGFSNFGYEVRAPGSSIYSTLPDNQYAAWSGTSMAAPVVSGVGALMRSFFWQRDIYSSRFIMGSIAGSGSSEEGSGTGVVNAYVALTEPPTPGVSIHENWLFDDAGIDSGNDDDGRIDAGETVHVAIELINRSGKAENVTATLTARAHAAVMDDPYVTIDNDTVEFGDIGPFAMADNGLLWDADGVIVGVEDPFVVTVDPSCPNDHVIPFVLTVTFQDGWDEDHTSYTRVSRFDYIVQRGKNVPTVISDDFTLEAEDFWIVGGPVLIEEDATLTIEPGTHVQWGAISDDPYNPGPQSGYVVVRGTLAITGTQDDPVHMFPSYLVAGQTVEIRMDGTGTANLAYARVLNPNIQGGGWADVHGFDTIDHAYLYWNSHTSSIVADHISNSVFHKLRGGGEIAVNYDVDSCLFDAGYILPGPTYQGTRPRMYNNVFLQDNENDQPVALTPNLTLDETTIATPLHVVTYDDTVTVLYAAVDGTAAAGKDFDPVSGTLTFEPGVLEHSVTVPVLGNTLHQPDRNFFVKLTHPTRVSIAEKLGEGTIVDDDPLISVGGVSILEGDMGSTDAVFTVSLSAAPRKTITVDFATANQTAMAGEDYEATGGTLTFLQGGASEQTIVVPVYGDTVEESNENFVVSFSNPQGAVLSETEAMGSIVTDDGLLLSVDDLTVTEGDGGRLEWSSFLGGNAEDTGRGFAVDTEGNAWVAGETAPSDWTAGGFDTSYNGGDSDGFIAKISPDGELLWSTYLGGGESDKAYDIAIDDSGNIWITGTTASAGWIAGGFDSTYNGGDDALVVKLDSDGQLLWSSYLGGSGDEQGHGIAVDGNGDAWITGRTGSSDWITGGFDTNYAGGNDAFLVKLSGTGALLWSDYLGGTHEDFCHDLAIDADGHAWLAGQTASANWVSGGFDTTHNGNWDAFVARVAPDGQSHWATYLGGSHMDKAFGIAVDPSGGAGFPAKRFPPTFLWLTPSTRPLVAGGTALWRG